MDLRKVYDATEDPLDNGTSINFIINSYFASKDRADYYGRLRDTESEFLECFAFAPNEVDRFTEDENAFQCILFNHWMNDIRRISRLSVSEKNNFFERVSRASYDIPSKAFHEGRMNSETAKSAFNKIVNKINKNNASITKKTQIDTFKNGFRDANVTRLLEILDWNLGQKDDASILSFKSNYLLTDQRKDIRNSVFLAVVPNKLHVYEFIGEYLKRCDKYNVPYDIDIPYDEYSKRIVRVNSTIENLGKNLAIFEDIAEHYPEMIENMDEPPVLCGRIKDWIGIGTFSAKAMERTPYGYTEKRAGLIVDAIEDTTKQYILENYKKTIVTIGKSGTIKNYLTGYTYDAYLRKIKETVDLYYKAMREDHTVEEAEESTKVFFGFSRNDLEDPKYQKMVEKSIRTHVNQMIANGFEGEYDSFPVPNSDICKRLVLPDFLVSSDKVCDRHLNIEGVFAEVLRKMAMDITLNDPRFKGNILTKIRTKFDEKCIATKSCFEDYAIEEMNRYSQKEETPHEIIGPNRQVNRKVEKDDR